MKTTHVLETCLYVNDLKKAEAFYTEVLGLRLVSKEPNRHAFFKCSHGMFLLFNAKETDVDGHETPPHGADGQQHVAFAMLEKNIESWREHLARCEVEIEKEIKWPNDGLSIYFRDPSNNSIELATGRIWGLPDLP